jgi:hypothetical protein
VIINVAVNELDQSRRFYEALLNIEFAEERHGDGPIHLNTPATRGRYARSRPSGVTASAAPSWGRGRQCVDEVCVAG